MNKKKRRFCVETGLLLHVQNVSSPYNLYSTKTVPKAKVCNTSIAIIQLHNMILCVVVYRGLRGEVGRSHEGGFRVGKSPLLSCTVYYSSVNKFFNCVQLFGVYRWKYYLPMSWEQPSRKLLLFWDRYIYKAGCLARPWDTSQPIALGATSICTSIVHGTCRTVFAQAYIYIYILMQYIGCA